MPKAYDSYQNQMGQGQTLFGKASATQDEHCSHNHFRWADSSSGRKMTAKYTTRIKGAKGRASESIGLIGLTDKQSNTQTASTMNQTQTHFAVDTIQEPKYQFTNAKSIFSNTKYALKSEQSARKDSKGKTTKNVQLPQREVELYKPFMPAAGVDKNNDLLISNISIDDEINQRSSIDIDLVYNNSPKERKSGKVLGRSYSHSRCFQPTGSSIRK